MQPVYPEMSQFDLRSNFKAMKDSYAAQDGGDLPLKILQESDRGEEKECGKVTRFIGEEEKAQ